MANADAPRGFWPVRHLSGGDHNRVSEYPIAASYTTAIGNGDAVKLVAGGGIEGAAAGNRLLGVFLGCRYTSSTGEAKWSKHWTGEASATEIYALVADDPNIVFGVQSAGSTVAADVGNLADHVATTYDTGTGRSKHELNGTTGTGNAGFRIHGKINHPENDWGTNVKLEVSIFEHEFSRDDAATPGV